jgi:predicted N-acyltransferase
MTSSRDLVAVEHLLPTAVGSARTRYQVAMFDSIADVDASAWDNAHGSRNLFLDVRFLRVVEHAFRGDARFRHVLFRNQRGVPVACATLSIYRVDATTLGGPGLKRAAERIRKYLPGFGYAKVGMCGLPVSLGDHSLGYTQEADLSEVLRVLNEALTELCRASGARVALFKEFADTSRAALCSLEQMGYRWVESPCMHVLDARFRSLDEYCEALRSHYRNDVRRSFRKFEEAGLRCRRLRGAAAGLAYTDELHAMYRAVVDKAENKLEVLSPEFFRRVAAEFGDAMSLTLIEKDDRILAFNCSLAHGDTYHFLFCGMDYATTSQGDVYFNMMFRDLDHGLREGVRAIRLGQASESFKARVGCDHVPLTFYVRGRGLWGLALACFGEQLFPPRALPPTYKIFKA